jgi:HAD superfamily hydrolase (TIGR01549 family)
MRRSVLLFDLDDTLVSSRLAYEKALGTLELGLNHPDYLAARAQTKSELPSQHTSARNRLIYFKAILEKRNLYSPGLLIEWMDRYENALSECFRQQWQELKRDALMATLSGFEKAVLTNETLRSQTLKLAAFDPDGTYFPTLMTSEEAGAEKPDTAPYLALLKRKGWNASDCIFISDQEASDLRPAHALGMRTVLTTEFTGPLVATLSDSPTLSRLAHLPELLKEWGELS